jgi:Opioid growth factor receptor (OGFr) conserved region
MDCEGRFLNDILDWPDDDLEAVHDFIQWLFPLPEPSGFNPDAPLLTEADIAAFKSDPVLQANLLKSFNRILGFLGFAMTGDGKVVEGDNFSARTPDVWATSSHNWLRISRILRSLTRMALTLP